MQIISLNHTYYYDYYYCYYYYPVNRTLLFLRVGCSVLIFDSCFYFALVAHENSEGHLPCTRQGGTTTTKSCSAEDLAASLILLFSNEQSCVLHTVFEDLGGNMNLFNIVADTPYRTWDEKQVCTVRFPAANGPVICVGFSQHQQHILKHLPLNPRMQGLKSDAFGPGCPSARARVVVQNF